MNVPDTTVTGSVVSDPEHKIKADKLRNHWRNLAEQDKADATDAEDIANKQIAALLDAKTEDEIWDADKGSAIQMRDAIGLEIEIMEFHFLYGDDPGKATRSGTYISCDAITIGGPADLLRKLGTYPGDAVTLQTGAELIVAKLTALRHADALPAKAVIAGTETRSGNTVLRLVRAPVRTVPGTVQ